MTHKLLFLLIGFPFATVMAQAPVRYRVESTSRAVAIGIDLQLEQMLAEFNAAAAEMGDAAIEGRKKPAPNTMVALISVTSRDSAGGRLVHLQIDSLVNNQFIGIDTVKGGLPPELRAMMARGAGGSLDAFMLNGVPLRVRIMPQMSLEAGQLVSILPLIFPDLRVGGRVGAVRSDTVHSPPTAWGTVDARAFTRDSVISPMVTTWRVVSSDTLEANIIGSKIWMLGNNNWSWKTESNTTHRYVMDAARNVREVRVLIDAEMHMDIEKHIDALSNKAVTNMTITRIGGTP